jgi:hypothetical protein
MKFDDESVRKRGAQALARITTNGTVFNILLVVEFILMLSIQRGCATVFGLERMPGTTAGAQS